MPSIDENLNWQRPQARHRPVRFLLSVLARLQILTPVPTAEKSPKRRLPASPLRPRGVEQRERELSALWPRSRRRVEREGPGSTRGGARSSPRLSLLRNPALAGESRGEREPEPEPESGPRSGEAEGQRRLWTEARTALGPPPCPCPPGGFHINVENISCEV